MGTPTTPQPQTLTNIAEALRVGRERLGVHSESASLDAQVLLAHVLGVERAWLPAHPDTRLTRRQVKDWEAGLARIEAGEALPYVLGTWEFFGLSLIVSPDVLIPRPETELLVETALEWLAAHPERRRAADVGTGSGCIAVALAATAPYLKVIASDISEGALGVARRNAARHSVQERVALLKADLLAGLAGPFDLICSNLPYIPSARVKDLDVYAREPHIALDGGEDGLAFIRPLLMQASGKLAAGGLLLAEIDPELAEDVVRLAKGIFHGAKVGIQKDLAGRPRLLEIQS